MNLGSLRTAWFPMTQGVSVASGTPIRAESYKPSYKGFVVCFSVDDKEAVLKRVEKKDGKIVNPKMSIGEYCFVGHLEDNEENRLTLHSNK
jgi:predicted enzyme related to lactoylglutathione lyase